MLLLGLLYSHFQRHIFASQSFLFLLQIYFNLYIVTFMVDRTYAEK